MKYWPLPPRKSLLTTHLVLLSDTPVLTFDQLLRRARRVLWKCWSEWLS